MDCFSHNNNHRPSPSQAIGSALYDALTDAKGVTVAIAMAIIIISNLIYSVIRLHTKFALAIVSDIGSFIIVPSAHYEFKNPISIRIYALRLSFRLQFK
jgi:hypothetical protein